LREGKALAELSHPNIVRYVAHGSTAQGDAYLAMEWLAGEDLSERLLREGLTVQESVAMLMRAAEGVAFAHARGLVHRDIKPSNLFLVGCDVTKVKVLDFGIVRVAKTATEFTRTGMMLGTPGFMAPEQVRGMKDVDARADVFALGCVLYRCLTGRAPFASDDPIAVLTRVLFEEVLPPRLVEPGIPRALDELVCRLLAKDAAQRPADAGALLAELAALELPLGGGGPVSLKREALTGREQRLLSVVLAGPSHREMQVGRTMTAEQAGIIEHEVRKKIEPFGGRFEALANGSFVVMSTGLGTPRDQAMQAARCALAIREAVPSAPIAVATGRSDASSPMPVGEVIERAVGLLHGAEQAIEQAEPTVSEEGGIPPIVWEPASEAARLVRIDDVTAALLGSRFDVTTEGDALAIVRERDPNEPDRTLLGKATPCVGRERELSVLAGIFDECVGESVANAVIVRGPAGVGKSRLRYEFIRQLRRSEEQLEVWMGRGDPMSAGAPFGMLAQALAGTMGLKRGESLDARRERVERRVLRHVRPEDAPRVIDFLGELVGVPFADVASVQLRAARQDPILMGDQMRRAWEDFLSAECRVKPVVLVLEDLHWGDLPTVRFVDAALRTLHDLPLMVLAIARGEIEELFPKLWAERRVQPLPLGELTARASEKLVKEALGPDASPTSVRAIVERAGGNVFYIEELIRTVAEGRTEGLPETVLAMTEARLEGLDPEARRVLRAASIFGQSFWRSGIVALLGGPDHAKGVDDWLQVLTEHEFVARRTQSRFPAEDELTFRHALLREAAYAMLTDKDRAVGHRLAALWLDEHGETEPLILAQHLEMGGERARAVALYRRAAEQALEGNDFSALIARAERGIACGADGEMLGALYTLQAEAYFWRGEAEQVDRCGSLALSALPRGSTLYNRALARLVISSGRRGRLDRVTELAGLMVSAFEAGLVTVDAEGACVFALAHAAAQLMFLGRYGMVGPLVSRADRIARVKGEGDPAVLGWADDARSSLAMREGDMAACVTLMASAAAHFARAGDLRQACVEDGYVGYGYLDLGLYDEAEQALRECMATAERLGLPHTVATAQHNLGLTRAMRGSYDDAIVLERAAIATFIAHGDVRLETAARKYLATILTMARDLDGAEKEARAALLTVDAAPPSRANALGTLASVLLAQGKAQEALVAAHESYKILEELGSLEAEEGLSWRTYAEALHVNGERATAREVIARACKALRARAAKFSNPAWRVSYLEKVHEHARIFALANLWRATP
jgi:tetratricopeptide (TPR) repeat protein